LIRNHDSYGDHMISVSLLRMTLDPPEAGFERPQDDEEGDF